MKKSGLLLLFISILSFSYLVAAQEPIERKMEGNGFDSPESALGAYIEALRDNDIDEMISTFAVETYVKNYSLLNMVEVSGAYPSSNGYVPLNSDFSQRMNIEKRRSEITNWIHEHYLILTGSFLALGDNTVYVGSEYKDAEDLLNSVFTRDDSVFLNSIKYGNEYYDPALINKNYTSEINVKNMTKKLHMLGAEEITSVVAKFYSNTEPVVIMADVVKYNEKWYISEMGGTIGLLLNLSSDAGGMLPLKFAEEGELKELLGG